MLLGEEQFLFRHSLGKDTMGHLFPPAGHRVAAHRAVSSESPAFWGASLEQQEALTEVCCPGVR